MKKTIFILLALLLVFSACSNSQGDTPARNDAAGNDAAPSGDQNDQGSNQPTGEDVVVSTPILKDQIADCLQGEVHPIAQTIAKQYADITDYDEVMGWFCNGAVFEDILNALTTEELSGTDAGDVLVMVANGMTWDQIWLELGITEE